MPEEGSHLCAGARVIGAEGGCGSAGSNAVGRRPVHGVIIVALLCHIHKTGAGRDILYFDGHLTRGLDVGEGTIAVVDDLDRLAVFVGDGDFADYIALVRLGCDGNLVTLFGILIADGGVATVAVIHGGGVGGRRRRITNG